MKLFKVFFLLLSLMLLGVVSGVALNQTSPSVREDFSSMFTNRIILAQATTVPVPTTQNTVTTTGPVSSTTSIEVGTLAGQFLMWLAAAFSVPVGTLLTLWLKRLFTLAGVQVTQQMSDQLDRTLVNGLNDAAQRGAAALTGKGKVEVHNQIVAGAVAYAQDHRAETIQALGLDPQSGKAVEALKARIETLINDPVVPTPAVLDPVGAPKPGNAAPVAPAAPAAPVRANPAPVGSYRDPANPPS